jgi:hypothetical protein
MVGGRVARHARALALVVVVALGAVPLVGAGTAVADGPTGLAQIITLSGNDGSPSACQLARVHLETGGITRIGPVFDLATQGCPFDMAEDGDHIYGVLSFGNDTTPSVLVKIDPEDGARTTVGSLGFPTDVEGLAFDENGTLWFFARSGDPSCNAGNDSCLYRLDRHSGHATLVAIAAPGDRVLGATATCSKVLGNQFLESDEGPPSGRLVRIDTETAALQPAPNPYPAGTLMTGIDRDDDGDVYGLGFGFGETGPQNPTVYRIDPSTGSAVSLSHPVLGPLEILAALVIAPLACDAPEPVPSTVPAAAVAMTAAITFTG